MQVQWGFLGSAANRLEACVCKIYDRSIDKKDNLRLCHIKKQGDCDIYCLYIRGKQLAAGVVVDPTSPEAIAHGCTDSDHSNEAAVAEIIFRDVIAEKIEKRKAEYAVVMRRIKESGFGAKVSSPEFQQQVTAQMEAMRKAADEKPFLFDKDADADFQMPQGFPSSDSDGDAPRTPASTMLRAATFPTPASATKFDDSSDSKESDSDSSDSEESDSASDDAHSLAPDLDDISHNRRGSPARKLNSGMGSATSCAHLPSTLNVQQHVHTLHKMEMSEERGEYVCGNCGGRGIGGMVYGCVEAQCAGWCSHLRCVLDPKKHDCRSLMDSSAVTAAFTLPRLPALQTSDMFDLRAVLIMDGCNGQVRAAKDILEKIFWAKGIDILKGSAQCSPSQNPLDCMRSFMQIKKSKSSWTWQTAGGSTEMLAFLADDGDFRKTMRNCSATDVNSFILSFRHLESAMSSCFTVKTTQSGWAKSGFIGLELDRIMSHWIGWKWLSAESVAGAVCVVCICVCEYNLHIRDKGLVASLFSRDGRRWCFVGCVHASHAALF